MKQQVVRFGIIGGGLMGKEFASAAARWLHLVDMPVRPEIVAVCDPSQDVQEWFRNHVPTIELLTSERAELLAHRLDAVYVAVPHYLHQAVYVDVIQSGRHLFAEKPFGMDLAQCKAIMKALHEYPQVICRISSEFPYFPAAQRVFEFVQAGRVGQVFEIRAAFNHCSDLNPKKSINWKRQVALNGEYGCMGDLGMHVCHLPFRLGYYPSSVSAVLSKVIRERPDVTGKSVPCDTWDNATLLCRTDNGVGMLLETKRISPGDTNTWSIEVYGTSGSVKFSTKYPKTYWTMSYQPGDEQAWCEISVGSQSTYPTVTGPVFEFGFSDSILQMWANYLMELIGETPVFGCVTPEEALFCHRVFSAALRAHQERVEVAL